MLQLGIIFQEGMILQRNIPAAIWGTAEPGETVTAEIQSSSQTTTADDNGSWRLTVGPLFASKEETLSITSGSETLLLRQVAVGEVWVAGGQSNMQFWMEFEKYKTEELPLCKNADIRFYDVPEVCFDGQLEAFDYSRMGIWRRADPDTLGYFSAVGYYFEKELHQCLNVPVGIIGCNWGGTTSSVWMKQESVKENGPYWWQDYVAKTAGKDMAEYWNRQLKNPINAKGNPLEEAFNQIILPATPGPEELEPFMQGMQDYETLFNDLMPQTIPGCLYEHMLKTIAPYSIKGFLWYQGESDDDAKPPALYEKMLTALIHDWRELWDNASLPFLIVQLPGWERWLFSENMNYEIIRKCQEKVTDKTENTFLCSISDAGEQFDIHPKNKKIVGQRLALLARGHVYGETLLCDAPRLAATHREVNRIILTFANAEGGLKLKGENVEALQILKNGLEIPYRTELQGNRLILNLELPMKTSVEIKFAQQKWYLVNLYNQTDIPAIPFTAQV